MRCTVQALPQRRLQTAVFGDQRQLAQPRFVGAESELCGRFVTGDAHGLHARHTRGIDALPRAHAGQKRRRAWADGIHAAVPIVRCYGWRARRHQRYVEARRCQRQREARADQTRANNRDITRCSHG